MKEKKPKGILHGIKKFFIPDPDPYKTAGFLEKWAELAADVYIVERRVKRLTRNAILDRQQLALEQLLRAQIPGTAIHRKVEAHILGIKIRKAMP
jgi:hypothetical protein